MAQKFVRIHGRVVPIGQKRTSIPRRIAPHPVVHVAKKAAGTAAFGVGTALSTVGGLALGAGGAALSARLYGAFKRHSGNLKGALVVGALGAAATIGGSMLAHKFSSHGRVIRRHMRSRPSYDE